MSGLDVSNFPDDNVGVWWFGEGVSEPVGSFDEINEKWNDELKVGCDLYEPQFSLSAPPKLLQSGLFLTEPSLCVAVY